MDVKHFNELIEVSQAVCDKANDQIADYCARKYGDAEGDTLEQQLRDYLFVVEEFRNLDCRGCVTAIRNRARTAGGIPASRTAHGEALSRLTSEPMRFLPPAVIGSSPSAYLLGNALALLDADTQEAEIKTFTDIPHPQSARLSTGQIACFG